MALLRFFSSIFDRLFVVAGALIGVQIPLFILQYTQRLAGHVAELGLLLNNLRGIATQSNKNLDQYIAKFIESGDPDFVGQGKFMLGIMERWENLNKGLQHLVKSNIWERPFVFIKELQYDIAKATFKDFQPGIQLTVEGFVYMALGAILGFCIYQLLCKLLGLMGRLGSSIIKNGTSKIGR